MSQNAGSGNTQPNPKTPEDQASTGRPEADEAQGAAGRDEEIAALRAQAQENWEKYLRAVAELDNLRKRSQREVENARKFGAERFAADVLPVRDSIEAALAAADKIDVATLLEGERATLRLLDQALQSAGVREIDPQGQPFDPAKHEAMTLQRSAELPPNSVAMVVQKGYELNDRLLRPARVIVVAEEAGQ
ncbi:MAG TPA: nucleotide exchange factor GrpE [Gammaproteobacteria bacterium]|nr:nucleotide exchange factor GrpE [Gammaproteobacteria bacterium]